MARCFLLLGAALLALAPIAAPGAAPGAAHAGDRYGPQVSAGGEAYAYRRTATSGEQYSYERRESEAPAGCAPRHRDASDDAYTCWEAAESVRRHDDQGGDRRQDERRYEESDGYEEARYEEGYYEEELYADEYWADDRDDHYDRRRHKPCQPRYDDRGRAVERCGEVRLSDGFFWGGGGVGPEYIDAGGGGGGVVYAGAGASASASASAHASVGVSIRIGGGKRGHGGGKPGHPPKGGGGCCKKH